MSDKHIKKKPPTALQQAGVNNGSFSSSTVELREVITATILRLHSLEKAEQLAAAIAGTGIDLPLQTGQSCGRDPLALCLRPNDWLLFSEQLDAETWLERLRPAIDPARTALLNNSDGLATFRLSGPGAPWLLNKLSGLDFQAGLLGGQHCARTRMAQIAVVVHYHQAHDDAATVFDLLFDRSLAKYLWDLLTASANHADDLAKTYGNAA